MVLAGLVLASQQQQQQVVALANAERRERGVVLSLKDGGFGFVQSPTRDHSVRLFASLNNGEFCRSSILC